LVIGSDGLGVVLQSSIWGSRVPPVAAIVTLTTDFGTGGGYAAAMKGVVLSINPAALVIDIGHEVPPQDIRHGAWLLRQAAFWFLRGTIHVAVVDPGVGTDRPIVYACIDGHHFVAPDNGLLVAVAAERPLSRLIAIEDRRHWLPEVSATFHGRDIMAPVAARLSLGLDPAALGPPRARLAAPPWPAPRVEPGQIVGEVVMVDRFGNLITDIHWSMLPPAHAARLEVSCQAGCVVGLARTYGQQPAGTLVALVGSSGWLELAVVNGSAAAALGAGPGTAVHVHWPRNQDTESR
jgi:S-adenosylmethionine hydrolase